MAVAPARRCAGCCGRTSSRSRSSRCCSTRASSQAALDLVTPTFFAVRRAAPARRPARAVAGRHGRPAVVLGAARPHHGRAQPVLLPLLRDGRGAVALRGLAAVRDRRRLRADPAGDHGRDRRLRRGELAVALGGSCTRRSSARSSLVCLATWRASARDREAFRSLVESLEEGVLMVDRDGQHRRGQPERGAHPRHGPRGGALPRTAATRSGRSSTPTASRCRCARRPLRVTGDDRRGAGRRVAGLRRPTRRDALAVRSPRAPSRPTASRRTRSSSRSPTSPRSARPPRRSSAPTPSCRSSPTSPRTTCPSRCGWSRATSACCAAATTAGSTPTPTSSSTTRSTAPRACGR